MSRGIHPVMVGTAGHIDHGKSSLVKALTGVDPDRLKEEKARGLTIDLGFAPLELRDGRFVGMVDVPGHERFVKNMVAGSTALDIALLVVAADDSVMPQTIEHVEILDLLGVTRGLVALTKIDLVDSELVELAEQEIDELLARTSLAGSRIVRVSNTTGQGLDEIRDALRELAASVAPRGHDGPFRMALQRVFRLEGIGTVVTGVPVSGQIVAGEEIEFLPIGGSARVRGIQAFGGSVERAVAGHSTALSVPDARGLPLRRGVVAATPGVFRGGDHVDVRLRVIEGIEPLAHREPIRFHTGTCEVHGLLSLLEQDVAPAGAELLARVLLDEPVSCAHGDRFLLRRLNPVRTVGGGDVVQIGEGGRYRRRRVAEDVRTLVEAGADPTLRALAAVERGGPRGVSAQDVAIELAIDEAAARELLQSLDAVAWHERGRRAFLATVLAAGRSELLASVERVLAARPHAASLPRTSLRTSHEFPPELRDAALDALIAEGAVRSLPDGRVLFLARLKPLAPADQRDLDSLPRLCDERGYRPPSVDELRELSRFPVARFDSLLARAEDEGRLQRIGEHVYPTARVRAAMQAIRRNAVAHGGVLEIPALRDELGTSRKWLIPLLEHVDGLGLTRLRGGERRLLGSSDVCRELEADDG
ncbi:MAG: selenocysteine-specific translation elongation factor [Planctomycetes bacterium]|nr:selenocysteine-specific translation elongation factor [Planctomycetota bacterium]